MSADYRKQLELPDGTPVVLRRMGAGEETTVREFFAALPVEDRDFLAYDLAEPEGFDTLAYGARAQGYEQANVILAEVDGQLAGVGFLRPHSSRWGDHVGEISLLVGEDYRRRGVGRLLARAVFSLAVELGLEKIIAEMTSAHPAAIEVFRRLGFSEEGRLTNYVKGRNGRKRDLVVMAYDVDEFLSRVQYVGLPEAFGEEWPAPR